MSGSTVNDVALAYVGGALREYLHRHGELPDETLVATCPISLRDAAEKGSGGNMLFGRLQRLETTTADPLDRLAIIAKESAAFRATSDKSNTTQLLDLAGTVPTALLEATMKAASALPFSCPTIANTTVTNVRGPHEPMYFRGARLVRVTGMGPLIGGLNLFHVVASYNGTFSIGVTADRNALPAPATYAECMETAFEELRAAAG